MLSQLQAVADDTRIRILELAARGAPTASDLNRALGMSQPRVAHHLKILVSAGVLNAERDGRFMRYTLPQEGFEAKLARLILEETAGPGAPAPRPRPGRAARPLRRDEPSRVPEPAPAAMPADPPAAKPEPPVDTELPARPGPGEMEDFLL